MSRRLLLAVPVLIAILLVVGAVAELSSEPRTSVADAITTLTAVLAVGGAVISVLVARDLHRKERTLEYAQRVNDPETFEARAKLVRFFDLGWPPAATDLSEWNKLPTRSRARSEAEWKEKTRAEQEQAKWDYVRNLDHKRQLELFSYANLLEEVGGSMNLGLLHRPTVKRQIHPASEPYFRRSAIRMLRKRMGDDQVWVYWEKMNRELGGDK